LSFGGASGSAYPPTRNNLFLPTNILYSWALPTSDDIMKDAARKSRQALEDKATALGQDLSGASVYGNYAIAGTSLEDIYGDNLPRLRALKTRVDPNNVMGLAGGWKFA
jgi:FAD/FMN-containing dehydrogenase